MNTALSPPSFSHSDNDMLAGEISRLAAHIHAATYRFLVMIREFDDREAWAEMGARSCAHWLNWRCGLNMHTAREKVRVAHALVDLAKISAAFERGELSYSKVRAVTRIANADNEDTLLNIALSGTAAQLERVVRCEIRHEREAEVAEKTTAAFEHREFGWHTEDNGSVVFFGRLPAEMAEHVIKAIEGVITASVAGSSDASGEAVPAEPPASSSIDATINNKAMQCPVPPSIVTDIETVPAEPSDSSSIDATINNKATQCPVPPSIVTDSETVPAEPPASSSIDATINNKAMQCPVPPSIVTDIETVPAEPSDSSSIDATIDNKATQCPVPPSIVTDSETVPAEPPASPAFETDMMCVPADSGAQASSSRPSIKARRADALVALCQQNCSGYEVTLHVPAGPSLHANSLENTGTIPMEAARRICCDAAIVPVSEDEQGHVLDIGRRTRKIPPAIRRALEIRDKGCCRFPGCTSTRFLKGHHIEHWALGGKTCVDNLVLLCWHHHHLVHEGGYSCAAVRRRTGTGVNIVFGTPGGVALPDAFRLTAATGALEDQHSQLAIDEDTCSARDANRSLDVNVVIDALDWFKKKLD